MCQMLRLAACRVTVPTQGGDPQGMLTAEGTARDATHWHGMVNAASWACLRLWPNDILCLLGGGGGGKLRQCPGNTRHRPYIGLLLGQRRIRWINNKPILGQCLMFSG